MAAERRRMVLAGVAAADVQDVEEVVVEAAVATRCQWCWDPPYYE